MILAEVLWQPMATQACCRVPQPQLVVTERGSCGQGSSSTRTASASSPYRTMRASRCALVSSNPG